eukprot:CAMPEP_0114514358 /NCGR_PEP_ID=MMETSP0109-20121206/16109_1 /TAXON_ID=29199 /ORGANISM="Chlorarachnion reptans, Strain CCCM449" /LENGTH=165 /DNA_ID=CAMNT_0001694389 /DNA_START=156 /DNA_END=653 /DNA_ORIENTATION=+
MLSAKPWRAIKTQCKALKKFPRFKCRAAEPVDLKRKDDLWVQRLSTGLYRMGVTKKVTDKIGGVGFVDICAEGSILVPGRPFGMVEGPEGSFTISSVVSGEVIDCNETLKKKPEVLADPEDKEVSWIIEVDSACDFEDEEVDWLSIDLEEGPSAKNDDQQRKVNA